MANLEIYNFDHVVLPLRIVSITAREKLLTKGNSGRMLFTLSAVSPIFFSKKRRKKRKATNTLVLIIFIHIYAFFGVREWHLFCFGVIFSYLVRY